MQNRNIKSQPIMKPVAGVFETVIGARARVDGPFIAEGSVRIEGQIAGAVQVTGHAHVAETGTAHEGINAYSIVVAGLVKGDVRGDKVQVLKTGRIIGDIFAQGFSAEDGAYIEGKIAISKDAILPPETITELPGMPTREETVSTFNNPAPVPTPSSTRKRN